MPSKSPFAGMNLSEQINPANQPLDQQLFTSSRRRKADDEPANQIESQQVSKPTSQQDNVPASQPANKPKSVRQSFPKRTYHLNPDVLTTLEDLQMALKRKYGVKRPLIEEIVEVAVRHLNDDFESNKQTSHLVSKLASQPASKPTGRQANKLEK